MGQLKTRIFQPQNNTAKSCNGMPVELITTITHCQNSATTNKATELDWTELN